jgi:hypothetical protein
VLYPSPFVVTKLRRIFQTSKLLRHFFLFFFLRTFSFQNCGTKLVTNFLTTKFILKFFHFFSFKRKNPEISPWVPYCI